MDNIGQNRDDIIWMALETRPENLDINNASYQLVVVSSELLAAGLCSVLVYVHYLFKSGLSRYPRFWLGCDI